MSVIICCGARWDSTRLVTCPLCGKALVPKSGTGRVEHDEIPTPEDLLNQLYELRGMYDGLYLENQQFKENVAEQHSQIREVEARNIAKGNRIAKLECCIEEAYKNGVSIKFVDMANELLPEERKK